MASMLEPPPGVVVEIQRLVADEMIAICSRNLDRLMSRYAVDIVFYNLSRPIAICEDLESLRQMWKECLDQLPDSTSADMRNLHIAISKVGSAVAYGHLRFSSADCVFGERHYTVLCRRHQDGWQIASESIYAPFRPQTVKPQSVDPAEARLEP